MHIFSCNTGRTRLFSHTQPQAAPFFSERETSALQLTGSGTSPVLSSSSSSSAPARLVPSAGDVCALLTIETVRVLCVCAYKQRHKAEGAAFRGAVFSPRANTKESLASTLTFVVGKACCHYREGKGLEEAIYTTQRNTHSHGRCCCLLLESLPSTLFVQ